MAIEEGQERREVIDRVVCVVVVVVLPPCNSTACSSMSITVYILLTRVVRVTSQQQGPAFSWAAYICVASSGGSSFLPQPKATRIRVNWLL